MKYAHYNEETKEILGYYDDELHEVIPEPNINLSEEEWQDALSMGATHIKNNKPIHKENKLSEEEAKQKLIEDFKQVVQNILDTKAKSKGYDDIVSACSYAGYENEFRSEGEAFGVWRAKCWRWGYDLLAKYQNTPTKNIPSIEEMLKSMPEYVEVK